MSETSPAYLTDRQFGQIVGLTPKAPRPAGAPDPDEILTTAELAAYLKMSEQWVRDHASGRRRPHIPFIVGGSRDTRRPTYRFKLSEVLECLRLQTPNHSK